MARRKTDHVLTVAALAVELGRYSTRNCADCAADALELVRIAGRFVSWPTGDVDYLRQSYARRTYATLKHYPGLVLKLSAPQMIKGLPSHPDGFALNKPLIKNGIPPDKR